MHTQIGISRQSGPLMFTGWVGAAMTFPAESRYESSIWELLLTLVELDVQPNMSLAISILDSGLVQ